MRLFLVKGRTDGGWFRLDTPVVLDSGGEAVLHTLSEALALVEVLKWGEG